MVEAEVDENMEDTIKREPSRESEDTSVTAGAKPGPGLRRLVFLVPVIIFVGIGIALGVGLTLSPRILPSALIDRPVPKFILPPLAAGYPLPGFSTADLRGHVSVVNIFASWCIPCRAEHPFITRLAEEAKVRVYGLNYKDTEKDARAWLRRLGNPYTAIGADRSGRVGIEWGVTGLPETFIVDKDGVIRFKYVGIITAKVLTDSIFPIIERLRY